MCNIEWIASHIEVNREEFFNVNINACNSLMDHDNIDKSYRI